MAVFYAVPISTYMYPMPDPLVLDELEIQEPIGVKANNAQTSTRFVLKVKSQALTNVTVSATLHPDLPLTGANPVQPAAGWTNALLPAGGAYTSTWTRADVPKGDYTFEIRFTPAVGAANLSYRVVIRVNAANFANPFDAIEPVSVI